jgi:hypothetical protein
MGLLVAFVGFDGSWKRVLGNLGVQAVVVAAIAPFVLALLSGIIPLLRQDAETG